MKKLRGLVALTLVASMALGSTACSKSKSVSVKEITSDEFIDACEEMGFKEQKDMYYDYYEEKYYHEYSSKELKSDYPKCEEVVYAYGKDDSTSYYFYIFEEEADAHDYFEACYYYYDDLENYEKCECNVDAKFNDGDQGYVTYCVDYDKKANDYDCYGAVYYSGNMVLTVRYSTSDKLKDKYCEEIMEFLDILGYDSADLL